MDVERAAQVDHIKDIQAEIAKLGGQIKVGPPTEFAAFIAGEAKRWLDVAEANQIKVD